MDSVDIEVLRSAEAWRKAGHRVTFGTIVKTWGSAPRPVGALVAIREDGQVVGSVSGGCVEDDLIEKARAGAVASGKPQLVTYGAGFSKFLQRRTEAATVAHLADVARLEWAREEAYYATDAPPLGSAAVASIPIERYPKLRFSLHPTVRLVASTGPVHTLWQAARIGPADQPFAGMLEKTPEQVLVVRPEMTVTTRPIGAADLVLLEALGSGLPLAEAAARAQAADAGFDLQGVLALHLAGGTFAGCG